MYFEKNKKDAGFGPKKNNKKKMEERNVYSGKNWREDETGNPPVIFSSPLISLSLSLLHINTNTSHTLSYARTPIPT